jgi:hypothetical protein
MYRGEEAEVRKSVPFRSRDGHSSLPITLVWQWQKPLSFSETCLKRQSQSKVPPNVRWRSIICFLNVKGERPVDIYKQIVAVYVDIMNQKNVTKWCCESSEGRINVHDK